MTEVPKEWKGTPEEWNAVVEAFGRIAKAIQEALYENLNEAMEGYLEVKLENNLPIPLPERTENYSGKFNVRLPKSLHQRLAIQAEEEGVSLNQLVLYKLAL